MFINALISSSPFFLGAGLGYANLGYELNQKISPFEQIIPENRQNIGKIVIDKASLLGFKKEIKVKHIDNHAGAKADGVACSPFGCAITIDLTRIPEQAENFIVAHEIAHIKNNDLLIMPGISASVSFIVSIALSIFGLPSIIPALIIGIVTYSIFSQYRELQADKEGLAVCTLKEKEGALEFFEGSKSKQYAYRNEKNISRGQRIFRNILITKTGEFRLDILHPALAKRISLIKKDISQHAN